MTSTRLTLALVLLIAGCYGAYFRWAPADESVIELSPGALERIAFGQESLLERALTDDERADATRRYTEEEILVREAFRLGLDQSDRTVRTMLVEHARRRILERADYETPSPTKLELRAYFDEHADRYRTPERVDLQQVVVPNGSPVSVDAVLAELRRGTDHDATEGGALSASLKAVTLSRIASAFGLEIATEIFVLPAGEWHGPFRSPAGSHCIRITARSPAEMARYEDVESYVEQDFLRDAADRIVDEELARIRRRYRIEIEDPVSRRGP